MKKLVRIILCLVVFVLPAMSQAKYITREIYDAAMKAADTKAGQRITRTVNETKSYKNRILEMTEIMTIERLPTEDAHWIGVRTKDGKTEEFLNLIYLGKYEYRKEEGADWKKRCVRNCSAAESGGGMMLSGTELPKLEEYLTFDVNLDGVPCTQYVFYRVYNYGKTLNFLQAITWIDANGLKLKEETVSSDVFPSNITRTEIKRYEYDPKDVKPFAAPIN